MRLKSDDEIAKAISKPYPNLTKGRKEELVAHLRAAPPEKLNEVHGVFTEGLPENERAFYADIVNPDEGADDSAAGAPVVSTPKVTSPGATAPVQAQPGKTTAPALNGSAT